MLYSLNYINQEMENKNFKNRTQTAQRGKYKCSK